VFGASGGEVGDEEDAHGRSWLVYLVPLISTRACWAQRDWHWLVGEEALLVNSQLRGSCEWFQAWGPALSGIGESFGGGWVGAAITSGLFFSGRRRALKEAALARATRRSWGWTDRIGRGGGRRGCRFVWGIGLSAGDWSGCGVASSACSVPFW
jgi:hypothetical protein